MLTEILHTTGPISIRAAAGTGKTYTLTQKVIHRLVHDGVEPEQVLALTFTDLAAAEMRERVYAGLEETARTHADPAVRARAELLKTRFHRNRISTIHAFCLDLLKAWPDRLARLRFDAEGALRPIHCVRPVRLMEPHRELQLQAEWKRALYAHYKNWEPLNRLLMRFGIKTLEESIAKCGDLTDARLRALAVLTETEWVALIRELAEPRIAERNGNWEDWKALVKGNPEWFKEGLAAPLRLEDIAQSEVMTKAGELSITKLMRSSRTQKTEFGTLKTAFDPAWALHKQIALTEVWLNAGADCGLESTHPDAIAFHTTRDLAQVVLHWRAWFQYQRVDAGQFTFDDYIQLAARLLQQDPDWRNQVAGGFRQILVDEFQDTDRTQWELISSLVEAGCEDVLVVGDIKQAIYEFRGGNVSVFENATRQLQGKAFDLSTSWRSLPEIIRFANTCFQEVFKEAGEVYQAKAQDLEINGKFVGRTGSVVEYRFPGKFTKTAGQPSRDRQEADALAAFLKGIRDGEFPEYAGIAERMRTGQKAVGILFRSRTRQPAFEWALRAAGLPFVTYGGSGFYERPESWDVLNLMRVLLDADDDYALVGVLRSPLVGMSDDGLVALREAAEHYGHFRKVLTTAEYDHAADRDAAAYAQEWLFGTGGLRNRISVERVSDVLASAFFGTAYLTALADADQTAANLRKAVELVRDLEANGSGTLMEVTEFWMDRVDEETQEEQGVPGADAPIRLITMHKSKGLEFPMVILADLDGQSASKHSALQRSPRDIDPARAFALIGSKNPDAEEVDADFLNRNGLLYEQLKEEAAKRQEAELRRLFYVAVTRASEHLVLWGVADDPRKDSMGAIWDSARDACAQAGLFAMRPFPAAPSPSGAAAEAAAVPSANRAAVTGRLARAAREARRPSAHSHRPAADGEDADARPPVAQPWADLAPNEAGNAIHAAIQYAGWQNPVSEAALRGLLARLAPQAGAADLDRLLAHVGRARRWLQTTFPSFRFKRHEMAFEVDAPEGWWRGIIDLYVQDADGNSWVVDFKTGRPHTPDWTAYALEAEYDEQLVAYCTAASALGLPEIHPTRALLLFTDPDEAVVRSLYDLMS